MFYKIVIKHQVLNNQGLSVTRKDEYLAQYCELFGEAEARGYEHILTYGLQDATVHDVKKLPNLREFVNENPDDDEDIVFIARIADVFVDEKTGKEKDIKYQVGVFAKDMKDANSKVHEYMKQGLQDMRFIKCEETKILQIL